jgi:glycerol uptake facilitator-like aquaporin
LTFAFNVCNHVDDYKKQALIAASTAAAACFIFGQLNNGGHFNPAVTIAVLIQRFLPSKKRGQSFLLILQNFRFAFICILS